MKAAWFHIEGITDALFESLRKHMLKQAFSEQSTTGFRLEEARSSYLIGSYIEKTEFVEHVADPFGGATEITRLRYEVTRFRVGREYPELELTDYPRSLRGFISGLSLGLQHEVSIERCESPIESWLDIVVKRFGNAEVRRLVVSALPIAAGVNAQVVFVGDRDIRKDVSVFLRNRKGTLIKASFAAEISGVQVFCDLTKQGRASFQPKEDEIIAVLRHALTELRSRAEE